MTEKDDELAKMRATLDQGKETLKEFAPILQGFHESLVEEGFTRAEALEIVIGWFLHTIGGGN